MTEERLKKIKNSVAADRASSAELSQKGYYVQSKYPVEVFELLEEIDRLKADLKDRESNIEELQKVAESWMYDCDKLKQDMHLVVSEAGQNLIKERDALKAENQSLKIRKDGAYLERNKCVVLIAEMALALGYKTGRAEHDPNDKEWEDDWRTVVYIDLPSGQVSWHFHDSQFDLVAWLPIYDGIWDGHSTELKYQRVNNSYLTSCANIVKGDQRWHKILQQKTNCVRQKN